MLPTQQLSGVEEVALVTSPDPGRGAAQSVLQQEVLCNHSNINVSQVMSSSPTTTPPIVVSIVAGACAGAISHSKLNPYQDDLMYAHVINSSHTHTHTQKEAFFVVDCEITNIHCVHFDDSLATIQTTEVSYFVVPHSNPLSKLQAVDMSGYTSKSGKI